MNIPAAMQVATYVLGSLGVAFTVWALCRDAKRFAQKRGHAEQR
ncbi:MAG TPA: hypothetical protein VFQ88_02905 [Nevskiaceae bacterium]|nr:hypothetical protein [Nevskiaceae bacterium]